jgi:hypothetical protein
VLRQLGVQVLRHLVDRGDDHLGVQIEEGGIVAHLTSLLPVKQNLPQTN